MSNFWKFKKTEPSSSSAHTGSPAGTKPKVIGIGLPKTGTTTLGKCFEILGYHRTSYDLSLLTPYIKGDTEQLLSVADRYEAFEDWPWFMLFREFDKRHPDCKFILTLRKDVESWLASGLKHAERDPASKAFAAEAKMVLAHYLRNDQVDIDNPAEIYTAHNRLVQEYFATRPDKLLTVCWEDGDDWGKLCGFLGVPVPGDISFPHENAAPEVTPALP